MSPPTVPVCDLSPASSTPASPSSMPRPNRRYLVALGISHCYASSYFTAVPEARTDTTWPTRPGSIPRSGTSGRTRAWVDALRAHGMGHIIDLVPNHMGIAQSANPWWQDVLENGESSRYADVFDIDWHPLKPELEHKVLLPVLGDSYGAVLERQEIGLEYERGRLPGRATSTHVFPIAPGTYDASSASTRSALLDESATRAKPAIEFLSILTAIQHLPGRSTPMPERARNAIAKRRSSSGGSAR